MTEKAVKAAPAQKREKLADRIKQKYFELAVGRVLEQAAVLAASFVTGMLSSRGIVFGKYAPFGVAAVAAVPKQGMWAAVLGAAIGYLFPSPVYVPARYLAALVAAAAIRWALSDLKTVSRHVLFAPLVSFLPLAATGLAMVLISGSMGSTGLMYFSESVFGAGCAFFFARTNAIFMNRRAILTLENQDVACLCVSVGILLLAFSGVSVAGVSLGRVLTILLVLLAARFGGASGGAIAGVAAGMLQGLSTAGITYISGAYGLGGLIAGAFSPMGAVVSAVGFVAAHTLASLQVGNPTGVLAGLYEAAAASIIFVLVPQSNRLSTLFSTKKDTLSSDALRRNMIMRLGYSSDALKNVNRSVDEIYGKLQTLCAPDIDTVYSKAINTVCAGCGLRPYCHEKAGEQTKEVFTRLTPVLRSKGKVEKCDFGDYFSEHCGRLGELKEAVNACYQDFLSRESAQLRATQVKKVVERQFTTTCSILTELASEFDLCERFDEEAAQKIGEVFRSVGVIPIEISCRVDKYGRMTVDAETTRAYRLKLNRAGLAKELSKACGRKFAQPCVSVTPNKCRFTVTERPLYHVECGCAQHAGGGGSLCGDSTAGFYDGCGRYIAIICDGMGTGGRAAVDGAMAAGLTQNLLQAGMGFDSALQIVNTALMAKSEDESLSTLDILCLDLFSGRAELKKAGAPATFFCSRKKVTMLQASSLPIGILSDVQFAQVDGLLENGDFAVLVSDGVTACGTQWLVDLLEHFEGDDPNVLAQQIVERALQERDDGHEDDVTAYALFVKA